MEQDDERMIPWKATHPGTILKYELEERNISQNVLATLTGMQKSHISELVNGKRPMTKDIADRMETVLGISAVTLVNLQTQYDYDVKVLRQRGVEEQKALNELRLYNELLDLNTIFKRREQKSDSAVCRLDYLRNVCMLPKPAELKMEVNGMFRKSSRTGLDTRMLMTWKILAETGAREQSVSGPFIREREGDVVSELVRALHRNIDVVADVKDILSRNGIAFCIEEKVDRASVDGYSFFERGIPYIVLTRRYDRIENFAFALMHEVGHIYCHYTDDSRENCRLSIPEYDNESREEREANEYAANALIPNRDWKNAPKVRLTPADIQRSYTHWAAEHNLNKWIALGRISYETGMYKFRSDESRKIG